MDVASPWTTVVDASDDPRTRSVLERVIAMASDDRGLALGDLVAAVGSENPLCLPLRDRALYANIIGRYVLDEFMSSGASAGHEDMILDVVRMPGRSACCNPYSDNMYSLLMRATFIETSGDSFRLVWRLRGPPMIVKYT